MDYNFNVQESEEANLAEKLDDLQGVQETMHLESVVHQTMSELRYWFYSRGGWRSAKSWREEKEKEEKANY